MKKDVLVGRFLVAVLAVFAFLPASAQGASSGIGAGADERWGNQSNPCPHGGEGKPYFGTTKN